MVTAAREWRAHVDPDPIRLELLRVAHWTAARWGLHGDLPHPRTGRPVPAGHAVDALLTPLTPALTETGDLVAVRTLLDDLRGRGTGAGWQRSHLDPETGRAAFIRAAVDVTRQPIRVDWDGRRRARGRGTGSTARRASMRSGISGDTRARPSTGRQGRGGWWVSSRSGPAVGVVGFGFGG